MGMELLQFSTDVPSEQEALFKNDPGFLRSLCQTAGYALADKIMRDASLHRRYELNDPAYGSGSRVRHVWRIAVQTDLNEIKAREKQMEEARAEGMSEAAAIVEAAAKRFEHTAGGCKWVIMDALRAAAREVVNARRAEQMG